jgi:hypothetical protein
MKVISGYTRDYPNQNAIPSAEVTIYYKSNNAQVESGGMLGASGNPVLSDGAGYFEWTSELNPGPVYAVMTGEGKTRVRDGAEQMQAGDIFVSELPYFLNSMTEGVVQDWGDEFSLTAHGSLNKITVGTGQAFLAGQTFTLETPRELTIEPNTTMALRKSWIIAETSLDEATYGKQTLSIEYGEVNGSYPIYLGIDPDPGPGPGKIVIGGFTTANSASISVVDPSARKDWLDLRSFRRQMLEEFPYSFSLAFPEAFSSAINPTNATSTAENKKVFVAPLNTATDFSIETLALGALSDVTTVSAAVGNALFYSGSQWQVSNPKTLIAHGVYGETNPAGVTSTPGVDVAWVATDYIALDKSHSYDIFSFAYANLSLAGARTDGSFSGYSYISIENGGTVVAPQVFWSVDKFVVNIPSGTKTVNVPANIFLMAYGVYEAGTSGSNVPVRAILHGASDGFQAASSKNVQPAEVIVIAIPRA